MAFVPHRMPNGRLNQKQVAVAARVLDQIAAQRGHIKPSYVVDAARPARSPIHALFTWDDTAAAEKWREEEARSLIRSIRVVRDDVPLEEQAVTRKFYSVDAVAGLSDFDGEAYLEFDAIASSPEYRDQVLHYALRELQGWKERHDGLKEFLGVYLEIESVGRNLRARSKVRRVKSASLGKS